MSTLKNFGIKAVMAVAVTGLAAVSAFASDVHVNLPANVNVGGTTLAGGDYTISEVDLAGGGASMFVFRSDKGETVSIMGSHTVSATPDQQTEVVLSKDNGALRLDRLFIEGTDTGFQFSK